MAKVVAGTIRAKQHGTQFGESIMLLRRTNPTTRPHKSFPLFQSSSSSKASPFCRRKRENFSSFCLQMQILMSSEESPSYPDDLELGLGLSIGGGGAPAKNKATAPQPQPQPPAAWGQYARILTGNDFPPLSSSSSSSSSVTKVNSSGSKRTADSPCSPPARSALSQVVGWPPVRTYRMNSQTSQAKSPVMGELFSATDKCESKNTDKTSHGGSTNNNISNEKGFIKTSLFVKVNMDGVPIGRKEQVWRSKRLLLVKDNLCNCSMVHPILFSPMRTRTEIGCLSEMFPGRYS